MTNLTILQGDALSALRTLPAESVNCCVTSPPYFGLRSYLPKGHPDKALEIGTEDTPDAFIARLVEVFREVRRVLKSDGTCWINIGDSYANDGKWGGNSSGKNYTSSLGRIPRKKISTGLKPKDLIGIPWMVAFALRADGWYLRQDIIWAKPNPMPESVTDRCTKAHEYIFLLSKSERYFYDAGAIGEPVTADCFRGSSFTTGKTLAPRDAMKPVSRLPRNVPDKRNKRSVWTVPTFGFADAHFAAFPPDLIKPCILAGCPAGGVVIDPFAGSGCTGKVTLEAGRSAILIELNPEYIPLIEKRCRVNLPLPLTA